MSKNLTDLTGSRFGRWTVLEYAGRSKRGEVQYKCRCDCGTERVLRRTSLTSGNSKSCGCLSRDVAKERGTTHGDSKSRLYRIWAGIIQRCCNDRERYEWEKYGGRGITVCEEWRKYDAFRDWALSSGYSEDLTIDRIKNECGYNPDNCKWSTMKEQQNNKRNNRRLTWNGETKTVTEWAEIVGIKKTTIKERLNAGWPVGKALTEPVRQRTRGYRPSAKMDLEG